jgi:hypothetical protein
MKLVLELPLRLDVLETGPQILASSKEEMLPTHRRLPQLIDVRLRAVHILWIAHARAHLHAGSRERNSEKGRAPFIVHDLEHEGLVVSRRIILALLKPQQPELGSIVVPETELEGSVLVGTSGSPRLWRFVSFIRLFDGPRASPMPRGEPSRTPVPYWPMTPMISRGTKSARMTTAVMTSSAIIVARTRWRRATNRVGSGVAWLQDGGMSPRDFASNSRT